MAAVLETINICKTYKNKKILRNISIKVHQGDIYTLIGSNNSGLTTLINIITGLAVQSSGIIKLFESSDLSKERERIGFVPQQINLYKHMTVLGIFTLYAKALGLVNQKSIINIIDKLNLQDIKNTKLLNLEESIKFKIALGLSLIGKPDLIIIDDLFAKVDTNQSEEIKRLLVELNEQCGTTIIISTHTIGDLMKISNRYGILNNGIVVDQLSKTELEKRCKLSLLVKVNDIEKAVIALEQAACISDFEVLEDNQLKIYDLDKGSGFINNQLFSSGITIYESTIIGEEYNKYFIKMMEQKYV